MCIGNSNSCCRFCFELMHVCFELMYVCFELMHVFFQLMCTEMNCENELPKATQVHNAIGTSEIF